MTPEQVLAILTELADLRIVADRSLAHARASDARVVELEAELARLQQEPPTATEREYVAAAL